MIFISILPHRIQHEFFIYFFSGPVIEPTEVFIFLDVSKVPSCLNGTDLTFQDSFVALNVATGFFS